MRPQLECDFLIPRLGSWPTGDPAVTLQNMEHGLYGLNYYIEARDTIREHLHELLDRGEGIRPMARVLRLLCLATVTAGINADM